MHLADPYSFTSTKPRINHEWLSESLMYLTYAAAGDSGLIALKLVLLVAVLLAQQVPLVNILISTTTADPAFLGTVKPPGPQRVGGVPAEVE
jgi:hypothetical protein